MLVSTQTYTLHSYTNALTHKHNKNSQKYTYTFIYRLYVTMLISYFQPCIPFSFRLYLSVYLSISLSMFLSLSTLSLSLSLSLSHMYLLSIFEWREIFKSSHNSINQLRTFVDYFFNVTYRFNNIHFNASKNYPKRVLVHTRCC